MSTHRITFIVESSSALLFQAKSCHLDPSISQDPCNQKMLNFDDRDDPVSADVIEEREIMYVTAVRIVRFVNKLCL